MILDGATLAVTVPKEDQLMLLASPQTAHTFTVHLKTCVGQCGREKDKLNTLVMYTDFLMFESGFSLLVHMLQDSFKLLLHLLA